VRASAFLGHVGHVWRSATPDSAQLTVGFMAHAPAYRVSVLTYPRKAVLTDSIGKRGQRHPRVAASQRPLGGSMRRSRSALARLPPGGLPKRQGRPCCIAPPMELARLHGATNPVRVIPVLPCWNDRWDHWHEAGPCHVALSVSFTLECGALTVVCTG
jgi:hypothetical protein